MGDDIGHILNEWDYSEDRAVRKIVGDDGKPWLACLVAIRRADKALRMYFEFKDASRWSLHPENVEETRRILLGDAFPEVHES